MLDPDRRKSYGVTSAILAWLVLFSYVASFIASTVLLNEVSGYEPDWHILLGLVALVVVVLRLLWWLKNARPKSPKTMPEKAYSVSRFSLLLMYLNVLQLSIGGLITGWAHGSTPNVYAWLGLPALSSEITTSVHSTGVLINCGVLSFYIIVNMYFGFRYKLGYRRMLPGVHV